MPSDRFQTVMDAFERASTLPPAQRAAFLDHALANDPAARSEVESLLSHHDRGAPRVATAFGLEAAGAAIANEAAAPMPTLRGDYRILRTIGEGGMGVVFEAEQAFPRRRVALKSLRPGLASARMLRRFRSEADFLARLQHPGIAQIYEAGVADERSPDQAFFVMELVQGESLTAFATARGLDARARWTLLMHICEAVQHAHQRGVIHRDLKPANILVTSEGLPKIVDFGVARAAEPDSAASMSTREGQLIGTPSYMSPEQLSGGEVDTRSDLYALGVIAYELLGGRLPFDLAEVPIARAARIVAESDPPLLSTLDRALRGDAEIIVAKAMAKEPDRRYSSAAEVAADIKRLLAGEAIMARRDSAVYIVGKQIRRHRTLAALLALVFVAVVTFAVYASVNAQRQRDLANMMDKARAEAVLARDAAQTATSAALLAKTDAEKARATALDELALANVERGRLASATGNLPLAEDILWREYFNNPDSKAAHWGLWKLYDQNPSEWTRKVSNGLSVRLPNGCAVARNGTTAAVVDAAGRLQVFELQTGTALIAPALGALAPGDTVTAVAIDPDGTQVIVGFAKGGLVVGAFNAVVAPMPIETDPAQVVRQLVLSADGSTLASRTDDGTVTIYSMPSGRRAATIPTPRGGTLLALSHDGERLAVATTIGQEGGALEVWSTVTSERLIDKNRFPQEPYLALAFSRDGSTLYSGARFGAMVAWAMPDASIRFALSPRRGPVTCILPSPDGERVLVANSLHMRLHGALNGETLDDLPAERFGVLGGGWIDNADFVVITEEGAARRIDSRRNGAAQRVAQYPGWTFSVAYSRDGRLLAVGSASSNVDVFDAFTKARISRHDLPIANLRTRAVRFTPDGQGLLSGSGDGAVRLIDVATGVLNKTLFSRRAEIYALDLNPAGTLVAAGYSDRVVVLIDLTTGTSTELPPLQKRIEGLAFSPDGARLAISGASNAVIMWDVARHAEDRRLTTQSPPWGVAFSPDGQTLYVSTLEGAVEVFVVSTGERRALAQGHQRLAPGLAVSPDGQLLATAGEEGIVRIWDTRTLRILADLEPKALTIACLAFNPASDRLAVSTAFRDVVEYDLRASDERIKSHEPAQRARLLPATK